MKLLYAPSGKRMIPYPPVGIHVLASVLKKLGIPGIKTRDLEIVVWCLYNQGNDVLLYEEDVTPKQLLFGAKTDRVKYYQDFLYEVSEINLGEDVGISTMGFEQLASTILLVQKALDSGSKIILGGQYWTEDSANELLLTFKRDELSIVVGDGWDAIYDWAQGNEFLPSNTLVYRDGEVQKGNFIKTKSTPPSPDYSEVEWDYYTAYAKYIYSNRMVTKRAHIYVWDKVCPYKCNFCRVSSGSNAKLSPPESIAQDMMQLLELGITQFNLMTNELNPTIGYLRKVVNQLMEIVPNDVANNIAWFTYLRPDYLDREDLTKLRRVGCRLVRYGVETGSQRLSDLMQKEYDIETICSVLKYATEADICNHVNFLVGYPGETSEDIELTLEFITKNKDYIHSVRINPFYLPPGSPLARNPEQYNIKLLDYRSGYWEFKMSDGTRVDKGQVKENINQIIAHLFSLNIGFAGIDPFFLIDQLSMYETRDDALNNLRLGYSYLWEEHSTEVIKSKIGRYELEEKFNNIENTIYQRGRNYKMAICTD